MSKLPTNCHWRDLVKVLEKFGFKVFNITGSHYVMAKTDCNPPKIITIIMQNPLYLGNLQGALADAGISREDFFKYYK
jgi:predicted RNA binding protein YcfA (HicA-like mRNA interferase family)